MRKIIKISRSETVPFLIDTLFLQGIPRGTKPPQIDVTQAFRK